MDNPGNGGPDRPRVALIAGPTASGKTALALALARRTPATIINADSAQVYRDLPILSAQPSPEEMAQAPHRLFGYLDGGDACSAARWANDAKAEIATAWREDRLPILVGGTGLYLRTLLEGIAPVPPVDPAIRERVRGLTTAKARAELEAADPAMAARLAPADQARNMRALEVILSTGRSIASWREELSGGIGEDITLSPLILLPDRETLYARCDRRLAAMMDNGAVEEVRALLDRVPPPDAPVLRAIGVPEIADMLAGATTREDAITRAQLATRRYAKRQYTWFRHQSPSTWIRAQQIDHDNLDALIAILLSH